MNEQFQFKKRIPLLVLLIAIISVPLFINLSVPAIRIYDESILANNAYEMYRNGNCFVTYYEGVPDMSNTKPPLMIWLQVGLMKILGQGELALRLPAALAGLFTCLIVFFFAGRILKDYVFGFIASMVLITSVGYVNFHSTRTGDYDVPLALFTTLYALFFFTWIEQGKRKYIFMVFIFLCLAVLTKGIAGMLFTPALFIYGLYRKKIGLLLREPYFYFGLAVFIAFAGGFYLLREHLNPGYLHAVSENELGGRFFNRINEQDFGFFYFYHSLSNTTFRGWFIFIPCSVAIAFFYKDKLFKNFMVYISLLLVVFFLVISFSKFKCEWYAVPMYPFMAMLAAVTLNFIYEQLQAATKNKERFYLKLIPACFLLLLFLAPYRVIVGAFATKEETAYNKDEYNISYYLKDAIKGIVHVDGQHICSYENLHWQLNYYVWWLNDKGHAIDFKSDKELKAGDTIIAYQDEEKNYLTTAYDLELTGKYKNVDTYLIKGRK